ncbi:MAG: hypothetical protein HY817_04270 [Candidatus Abawacabacteria bacterium]|nr:hypothetical protein [Candidatus Abawacabacteria bacterium]
MIKGELEYLGLTQSEVAVYLALLELGGGVVSALAKKAQLNRVTSYNTLSNLVDKGYVTVSKRKNVQFYVPESPTLLVSKLEEKYQIAQKVLPELIALQNSASFTPKIRYYEERQSITTIFEDMTKAQTEILGYTNFASLQELFPEVLGKFANSIMRREQKVRFLAPNDEENDFCIKSFFTEVIAASLLEVFTVNPKQFPFRNGVFFYDDKMAIISYDKTELLGVIIQSAVNTQTQKAMFDLAWLGATSFIVR